MYCVLLVYRSLIPSVRLCGYEQLSFLHDQGIIQFDHASLYGVKRKQLSWADVVIFVRGDTYFERSLVRQLNKLGKRTVYVLDDDLLNVPDGFLCTPHYRKKKVIQNIKSLMQSCSLFVSPSPFLIELYGKKNQDHFQINEPAVEAKKRTGLSNDVIRFGFAGSLDRADDLDKILSGAIKRVMRDYPQKVQFEFMGARPTVATELGLQCYPYEDSYQAYRIKMEELNWDVGLAPMPAGYFYHCKHYNKLVEYASFGIAGIYSDVEPYRQAVVQGKTGLLCENSEQAWYEAMVYIICNPIHLQEMKQQVSVLAATTFSVPACAEQFIPIVSWKCSSGKFPPLFVEVHKFLMFFSRAYDFVLRNKWGAVSVAYEKCMSKRLR